MKRSAVLYHYPCPDGAFAALAAHLYFSHSPAAAAASLALFFPNTVYSPLRVEDLPLDEIDDVYLLDFVGPPGFVQQLSRKVGRVVVLDHHKTALEMLGSGMSASGNLSKRVRSLFEYVEDGDLWRWRLPNSKAFSSGLKDLNLEFDVKSNPSLFQQLLSLDLDSVLSQGMSSLAHKQRIIDEVLEQSYEIALGGGAFGHCLAVNADSAYELRSELGNQLANKSLKMNLRGIGAVVYRVPELENDLLVKVSLRSIDDEDTTSISQEYGGGGHKKASSFMINHAEFQRWKDSANNSI